ncbi:MAG TPA: glycosyltransferase family 1 protein [Solirubrobacteraceae bacterium]
MVLNALFLDPAASGGPETYLRGLAPALAAAHPQTRFTVVTTGSGAETLRADGWEARFGVRALPCEDGQRLRRQVAEQVMLPALARRLRADVLHSLASVAPIRAFGVAHVITVHDVTFFRQRTFGAVTTFGMREVVGRAARHADALVTASRVARDDICDELGLDPMAFTVVPHGADLDAAPTPAPEADVRARYGVDGARVVLCVAAKRPHKNQEVLVRAMPLLDEDVVLVLAGHPEPYDAYLRGLAGSLGVSSRIRFANYVPAAELEALWRLAGCGAFPTLAEGFGIPVVEAMARGVGVAVSDIPVLREVGGDVPRYFDPHDAGAAAEAVRATLADPASGARGPARAARFTWAAAAEGTWEAYERACTSR